MRHPTEGVLRRLLDEPAGVSDPDRRDVDLPAAWRRLATALPATGPERAPAPARAGRSRALLRRPVVAALAVAVVLTGAGTAAANDWLQIFRTEEIAPVSFSTSDLVALPDLSAYGDVELTGDPDVRQVTDAAAAAAQTGLDVPEVAELPQGIGGDPTVQVGSELSAVFTFSAERAAQAAAESGATVPPPPPGLDGSQVRLVAGPGVAQVWSSGSGLPGLIVGRAVAPTAYSSGVPFETVRDHLLSLPGLPEDIAAQLRTFTADGSTLPIPVPTDLATSSTVELDGVQATVLESNDQSVAAVVWVDDGVITAVAGSLDADELLTVARGLR
jgi:hypothetical protein